MADKPFRKMMYGIMFTLEENPAEKRRSRWKYTCCGLDCRSPCIHYKFKVKHHVENKHPHEWEKYAQGLVPEEARVDEVPLEVCAAPSHPAPSPSMGAIALQVLIRFACCKSDLMQSQSPFVNFAADRIQSAFSPQRCNEKE
jgi:hypothetical protein